MQITDARGAELRAGCVYALGRNYAEHAREMGAAPDPVVFIKPASALLQGGGRVEIPEGCQLVHHEVELVLLLGAGPSIDGVAIGIDLTARDLQSEAKTKGAPWARSKGFPGSAPISAFAPAPATERAWAGLDLSLSVEGEQRQQGSAAEMTLAPHEILRRLGAWFTLEPGDLVFTGTPAGVGPIEPGQRARAACEALGLSVEITLGHPR